MEKCEWKKSCQNDGVVPCSDMDEVDSASFYGGNNEIVVCVDCHEDIETIRQTNNEFR